MHFVVGFKYKHISLEKFVKAYDCQEDIGRYNCSWYANILV